MNILFLTLLLMSCSKENAILDHGVDYDYGRSLSHEQIVLGNRRENPYKTENITRALASLYPTKAGRIEVTATDLYVRFLPADKEQCEQLRSMGLELIDHPLDYDIAVDGDWYHDPEIPEGKVTWQYAVVPVGFKFPDIEYEVIHECYINRESSGVGLKSDGIDWASVERESYLITGNEDFLETSLTKASEKKVPSGRITIVDAHANGAKPFGVAGVKVLCHSFVKFDTCWTDRDGYYTMSRKFSTKLRYRLIFQNQKGFAIGLNLILVPASVSTLGETGPEGVNITITSDSDDRLFQRCAVNNAAYDYYSRCDVNDLSLSLPPSDLRIWIFKGLNASSAMMLHHGAVLSNSMIEKFIGKYSSIIAFLLPDITLGTTEKNDYRSIYSLTCHELAHASHFSNVGTTYWNEYIWYIIDSYIRTGGMTYGDGSQERAGYCEIGESWAYYLESRLFKDRYGGTFPTFGTSFWFKPQIFRFLGERGMSVSQMFSVLDGSVIDKVSLKSALLKAYPKKRTVIEQVFSRY